MIRFYFGSPGCGKTTVAIKRAKQLRRKQHCHLNFEHSLPGASICNLDGLGAWTFCKNSVVFCDESGIEFNSRNWKKLQQRTISYFKKHRHYHIDMEFYSQSWGDTDVILRDMASELWYLRKIGPWTLSQRVYKFCTVDKNSQQIIDGYRFASGLWLLLGPLLWPLQKFGVIQHRFSLTFRPFYYRYFDSWSTDNLPVKEFPVVPERRRKKQMA